MKRLNVFTYVPKGVTLIKYADEHFIELLNQGETFDSPAYNFFMQKIDNIRCRDGINIVTPFGKTTMHKLSTGCKTIMLAEYYKRQSDKYLISFDLVGDNVFDLVEEHVMNNHTMTIYFSPDYRIFPNWYNNHNLYKMVVDGKEYNTTNFDLPLEEYFSIGRDGYIQYKRRKLFNISPADET